LAATQDGTVAPGLMAELLRELGELQDRITAERRADLIGTRVEVLVDEAGVGRTYREAPEIDGVVLVADDLPVGEFATVVISASLGPDLVAT
jgi:ribosomal protein S12 methylthiotransferase